MTDHVGDHGAIVDLLAGAVRSSVEFNEAFVVVLVSTSVGHLQKNTRLGIDSVLD